MDTYSDPTNYDRAEWARQTFSRFAELTGSDTLDTQVIDLLADLLHLLDRVEPADGPVIWSEDPVERLGEYVRLAVYHYGEELVECEAGDDTAVAL